MSCKLGDKCDNVFACNILRPNVELLGCNFYKPKKPMTNEEWLKSTKDTNQFACEMCELFEILCTDCKFYDKSMRIGGCTLPSWLKEVHQ